MTVGEFLRSLSRLDALILLEDATGRSRAALLAHDDDTLTSEQLAWLAPRAERRRGGEPLAYIRGRVEFYGRSFAVSPAVLVPRPESEDMIALLKTVPATTICDVGTGSGALGITAKLERPAAHVTLLDISPEALAVAQQNAKQHGAAVTVLQSDLTTSEYDVLLANLPYVPDDYPINRGASFEPGLALYGGPDGLALYRRLFAAARAHYIITEAMPQQHAGLAALGGRLVETRGYAQLFSIL